MYVLKYVKYTYSLLCHCGRKFDVLRWNRWRDETRLYSRGIAICFHSKNYSGNYKPRLVFVEYLHCYYHRVNMYQITVIMFFLIKVIVFDKYSCKMTLFYYYDQYYFNFIIIIINFFICKQKFTLCYYTLFHI